MRDETIPSTDYVLEFCRAAAHVAAQADCSLDEATDLMVERAEADACSLGDLAVAIVKGRVRIHP